MASQVATFQPSMTFARAGSEGMVDSSTARRTTPSARMRLRPGTIQALAQSGRLVRPGVSSSAGANGASSTSNGAGTTDTGAEYDVGVDTVLQEAAAAAAGGSSYYPGSYSTETPYSPPPGATPGVMPSYEVDTMMVSGDIEEPKEGIMGFVEENQMLSAALAALVGFLGYRYAKKQGMI